MKQKQIDSGFRLEVFNFFIIFLTVIITVSLTIIIFNAHKTYDEFRDATERYIECREAAEKIHTASDDLTAAVRGFVNTGERKYIDNYFKEAKEDKNREKALEAIKKYDSNQAHNDHLEAAVRYSMELMDVEYYAMRLVLEADEVPESSYHTEIKHTVLREEHKELSQDAKRKLARDMVYSSDYSSYKADIYSNISNYTTEILEGTQKDEENNKNLFEKFQSIQIILIIVLLGVLTLNVSFTSIFMIRPLRKSSKLIVEQMSLPERGATEMRTFARLYNKVLEKTKTHQAELSYEATHDSLTGINNRSVFDELYRTVHSTDDMTLLLIDVDTFKGINDTHGHETGDKVLQRVASTLHTSFRSGDVICRIGGDEFAVILNGVSAESKDQLNNKLSFVRDKLSGETGELPKFTLSIGVAFGDSGHSFKALYKNADIALYNIKTTTKDGICYFSE